MANAPGPSGFRDGKVSTLADRGVDADATHLFRKSWEGTEVGSIDPATEYGYLRVLDV